MSVYAKTIAVLYSLILLSCCNMVQKKECELLKEKYQKKEAELNNLKDIIHYQNVTNNISIEKKIHILKDRDTIDLCEEKNLAKTIFFYFNEHHCSSCVKEQLLLIERFNTTQKNEVFVKIVASYSSPKNLKLFLKSNHISSSAHYILEERIELPIASYNIPFYFLVNNENKIIYVNIADKDDYKFNEIYLNEMRNFIQNNEN